MGIFSKKTKNKISQKSWQRRHTGAYAIVSKKVEKRESKFSRFLFWLLLLVFLGICVYILLFSPYLEIEAITVEGNQDISSQEIENWAGHALEGKYYNILPKKNFFLADKKNIKSVLESHFDRLEVAAVEKKFPKIITIVVTERKPEVAWCSAGVCYFADKNGLVYGGASGTEEELESGHFLTIVDESAIPVEIGKTKLDPDYIGYIETADNMLRNDLKLDLAGDYHTPGMASGEISVITSEGWTLKLSSELSAEEAKKITQTLFENELNDEVRKNLDYLDLRVRGKVYYKLR